MTRFLPLVDTHAHLNLSDFAADLDDVATRSRIGRFPPIRGRQIDDSASRPFIAGLVCPGVDLESSRLALELSRRFDFVFAAAGVHPNYTAKVRPGDWDELERLVLAAVSPTDANDEVGPNGSTASNAVISAKLGRLVAIGETGLDRHWDDAPFDVQVVSFRRHLELGRRTDLPVLIHSRDANDDLTTILRDFCATEPSATPRRALGVVHSFDGTPEQADEWVELGLYLGFGGFVTYPNQKFANVWEAARRAPVDRILLETDSPFLTPHPLRGKIERNEPLTTAFVAKRLAELRGVTTEEIVRQTTENAVRLFRLPPLEQVPENVPFS